MLLLLLLLLYWRHTELQEAFSELIIELTVEDLLSKDFTEQKSLDLFLHAWLEGSLNASNNAVCYVINYY